MLIPAMLNIFATVVLPVILVAGVGFLLHRIRAVPPGPLSQVTLYALSPALTFSGLYRSEIALLTSAQIFAFAALLALALFALTWSISRLMHMERTLESGFYLTTIFMNAGNYGLPVALLAFGEAGLETALIFLVAQGVLAGTLAVYLAARGSAAGTAALRSVLRQPLLYAAVLPLLLRGFNAPLPAPLLTTTTLLGEASVPLMLLVLGIELSTGWKVEEVPVLSIAIAVRLVISAFIGAALTSLLRMDNLTRDVLIVEAAMPSAIYTIILATEFGARPRFVTSAVTLSTLLSIVTTTLVVFAVTRGIPA